MKAIVRNILFACLISTFAFFGAIGTKYTIPKKHDAASIVQQHKASAEADKESMACLSVAFFTWGICIWRCAVLNRRLQEEREYRRRFNDYMRNAELNQRRYQL